MSDKIILILGVYTAVSVGVIYFLGKIVRAQGKRIKSNEALIESKKATISFLQSMVDKADKIAKEKGKIQREIYTDCDKALDSIVAANNNRVRDGKTDKD